MACGVFGLFGVSFLGLEVWCSALNVWCLGFEVLGFGFRVWGLRFGGGVWTVRISMAAPTQPYMSRQNGLEVVAV